MPQLEMFAAAAVLMLTGGAMAFYEWSRVKGGRPLFKGREIITLYWISYLSLFMLSITFTAAAIIR